MHAATDHHQEGAEGRRALTRFGGSAAILLVLSPVLGAQSGLTSLCSVDGHGFQGQLDAFDPAVSRDGLRVAFVSGSDDLVPGDTNAFEDVFLHDRLSGATQLVSVSSQGALGNGRSRYPSLSRDGRLVAFVSLADNLVPGDVNPSVDVFVRDLDAGTTELVSLSTASIQADDWVTQPSLSADGRFVYFWGVAGNLVHGDVNGVADVFVRDRLLSTTALVSQAANGGPADGASSLPRTAGGGRYAAFVSQATNLVVGDTNGVMDAFLFDRHGGRIERVSVSSGEAQAAGPSLEAVVSADGRVVVFSSDAPDLVPGDTNGVTDVFARDRASGTTVRISVGAAGAQANGPSREPDVSADGRWVVFSSSADNLVAGDANGAADVFRHDRLTGVTTRISTSTQGVAADGDCSHPRFASDVGVTTWSSSAASLVPGDANGAADVFAHQGGACPLPARYCPPKVNSLGCVPAIDWSGTAKPDGSGGFQVLASSVLSQQAGVLLCGASAQAQPFGGGMLCVVGLVRIAAPSSGGQAPPGADCSGRFDFHLDQANLAQLGFLPGDPLFAQVWSRDAGFSAPQNLSLSAALQLVLCP